MNTVQDRLREWRKAVKGLSLRELREAVNGELPPARRVSLGTVANYERPPGTGGTGAGPRADFLAALKRAFPELRLEWLLLGEGEPSELGRRIAELAEGSGGPEPGSLAGRLQATLPDLALLSPEASALFVGTLARYATGAAGGEISEEQILEFAADLRWILFLPLSAWGFEHEPEYETFSRYCVGMLHALGLLMPPAGRGDPIAAHAASPVARLRTRMAVGLGTGPEADERG
ncbi:MAG: hypothetical protein ACE5HP_06385 [Gemmatimonadota bacterium]